MAPRSREDRSLTAGAFARLLARLDADVERAAIEYERLHRALVRFFDWRGAPSPEDCADEALDRLARRLEEDVEIKSVRGYALGIARLVLLECQREPTTSGLEGIAAAAVLQVEDEDRLRVCFDKCLEAMDSEERAVVTNYYEGERGERILNRRLAGTLGVSENALRIRLRRLRDRLEQCVRSCVAATRDPS
jgi:DNA-directed RNA polymerase specialized sigma24 family protein